jgi:hypothetical protein
MSKSVRFNPIDEIITTYSADEYDRSCFASAIPISYTFRPAVCSSPIVIASPVPAVSTAAAPIQRPAIKPLDLSVIPNSRRRALESPNTPNNNNDTTTIKTINKSSKKPRLSINTQSLTPLFFSGLSTHYKCKDEEEEEHGYLVPVLAC